MGFAKAPKTPRLNLSSFSADTFFLCPPSKRMPPIYMGAKAKRLCIISESSLSVGTQSLSIPPTTINQSVSADITVPK